MIYREKNTAKTIYHLSSCVGLTIFCMDISPVNWALFLRICNCNWNVWHRLCWLILFWQNALYISLKGKLGCLFYSGVQVKMGTGSSTPLYFFSSYFITLGIGLLFQKLIPVLLSFFFKHARKNCQPWITLLDSDSHAITEIIKWEKG